MPAFDQPYHKALSWKLCINAFSVTLNTHALRVYMEDLMQHPVIKG